MRTTKIPDPTKKEEGEKKWNEVKRWIGLEEDGEDGG